MATRSTILVTGGSGFIGTALLRALVGGGLSRGEGVRATTRRSARRATPPPPVWVECDVLRPDTLPAALEGVSCAYYLVHSMGAATKRSYRSLDRRAAQTFAAVAARTGVERIVYLGGVAPAGRPSEHLASRLEVGEILRAGSVPTLELRASMVIGAGSASWRIVRDLAARLPAMVLPAWLRSRTRPVALDDVIGALVDARRFPLPSSTWFDLAGPESLTGEEILRRVVALDDRRLPALAVPVLTPRLSAMWLRLITGVDYDLASELVLGLTTDLLPRDERYWELTNHPPRIGLDEAARRARRVEPERRPRFWRSEEALVRRFSPRAA